MNTVEVFHIAAEEAAKGTNPPTPADLHVGRRHRRIAGQWLVAHFNRRHERGLADLAARREAYAKFRRTLRELIIAQRKTAEARQALAQAEGISESPASVYEPNYDSSKASEVLEERKAAEARARNDLLEAETLVSILATGKVRRTAEGLEAHGSEDSV